MAPRKLTAKQKAFVKHFLANGLNATQAAKDAGYSEKTAAAIGSENLRKPHIQSAIEEAQKEKADDLDVTVTRILKEYAAIAFTEMSDVAELDAGGQVVSFKPFDEWPDAAKKALQEIKTTSQGLSVKFHSKNAALTDLAKHLGMFIERKVVYDATAAEAEKDSIRDLIKDPELRDAMRLIAAKVKAGTDAGDPTVH